MKTLAIIPARAGSKGVPQKNIKLLGGKPLIAYSIEAATESGLFSQIFVSTDSEEIAQVAIKYGANVPVLRPKELALDSTPTLPVITHAVEYYRSIGEEFDAVCLLQPTSPFRTAKHIKEVFTIFNGGKYSSVMCAIEVPAKYNPHWVYKEKDGKLQLFTGESEPISRRQELPKVYSKEGSVYLFSIETLATFNNIYGDNIGYYLMSDKSINIDTTEDWLKAEEYIASL